MKKKLLLVTAFLAIAGTAMAVTTDEIGKLYHETSEGKKEMYEKEMKKEVADFPKIETVKQNENIKKLANLPDGIDAAKYNDALKNVMTELEKQKGEITPELEASLKGLNTAKAELIKSIDARLADPKVEDKAKLNEYKGAVEAVGAVTFKLDKAIDKKNELEKSFPEDNEEIILKAIKMITPNSMVNDQIVGSAQNSTLRQDLFKVDAEEMTNDSFKADLELMLKNYLGGKDALKKAEDKYKEEMSKKNNETERERAKKELDLEREEFLDYKNVLDDLLKIANTDIESYSKLVGEKKAAEEARIVEKVVQYKKEKDFFAGVAWRYTYGDVELNPEDLEEMDEEEVAAAMAKVGSIMQTNAALRITENAMNIENNKKAIARNAQDIKDLRKDHNRGMAQMAAMASVDFGNVKARTVKVGAAVGQHSSETAVAVGVAVAPTDALMVNAKWSTSANSIKKSTLGLGATYEFNF